MHYGVYTINIVVSISSLSWVYYNPYGKVYHHYGGVFHQYGYIITKDFTIIGMVYHHYDGVCHQYNGRSISMGY